MTGDRRREERLDKAADVVWTIAARGLSGHAALLDVSAGGACLRLTQPTLFEAGTVVALTCRRLPLPLTGRVLWSRPAGSHAAICGIEFPPDPEWASWLAAHDRALQSGEAGLAGHSPA